MFEPIKKLGQNFLTDVTIAQTMVEALKIQSGADIIEIGSGLGMVTEVLVASVRQQHCNIFAVEIDSRFTSKLSEMFLETESTHVIQEDILQFLPKFQSAKPTHVIGSLPFYITSPIIHSIIKMQNRPQSVVLLIQKEVGEKLMQDAPDGSYLSTFVQSFYNVEYVQDVPNTKFNPVPEVDGAVISLTKKTGQTPELPFDQIEKYESFLHRAFRSPRKMLNKVFSREELAKTDVGPGKRPQEVSADQWLAAFKLLNP